jgi:hypothetical protein
MTAFYFTLAFLLSFLTESGVEYILGTPIDKVEKLKPYKWLLMYPPMILGVGLSYYYKLDLIALLPTWLAELTQASAEYIPTPVGMILSGLAIGRGSNYLHQVMSQFFPVKPPTQ